MHNSNLAENLRTILDGGGFLYISDFVTQNDNLIGRIQIAIYFDCVNRLVKLTDFYTEPLFLKENYTF